MRVDPAIVASLARMVLLTTAASPDGRPLDPSFLELLLRALADRPESEAGGPPPGAAVGGGAAAPPPDGQPPAGVREAIAAAARATGLPERLLAAVARVESGWDPRAVSPAGATGLMQLMPATARALGVDPWDPMQNALGGARYLAEQLARFGDLRLALAAYNAGPGRVMDAIERAGSRQWEQVARYLPEETRRYVPRVLDEYA